MPEVNFYDPSIPSPANDLVADAQALTPSDEGCATVDNTNADLFRGAGFDDDEIISQGDTEHHPQSPSGSGQTVWFKWTAPNTRSEIFDTDGSQVSNTIVTVYDGNDGATSPGELALMPNSVDGGVGVLTKDGDSQNETHMWRCRMEDRLSCFELVKPTAGQTYYIQIDTEAGTNGEIQLNWRQAPLSPSLPHYVVAGSPDLDANSVSHTTTPSFFFSDGSFPPYSDPHFVCMIDSTVAIDNDCTPGWRPPALSNGPHRFAVALKDADTHLPGDTATIDFSVDVTLIDPPTIPVIDSSPPQISNSSAASFTYHDGPTGVSYLCSLDSTADGDYSPCPAEPSAQTYSGLVDGSHVFYVRSLNSAGVSSLPAMYMWLVDTRPPATPVIVSGPPTPTTATTGDLNVSATLGSGESLRCKLVPGFSAWTACSPGLITYVGLTDGSYTFSTKAVDAAGNESAVATYGWTVDNTPPPPPVLDTKPPTQSGNPTAPFTFHDSESGVTFSCAIDGGSSGPCASPYGPLSDGQHTFCVKAKDGLGNTSSSTCYTWTIDTAPPPAPVIDSSPAPLTNATGGTFGYHDGEDPGVAYECQLDGGGFSACAASGNSYSGLSDGTHTFKVRAVDAAGNRSSAASYSWVVDATSPPAPAIDTNPPILSASPTASFTFHNAEDPNVAYSCSLDGAAFGPCPAGGYGGLSDGSHTFRVRGTDPAGNAGPAASYTWTVDTTPPTLADHPDMLAEADSASGAPVGYAPPTAADAIDPSPAVSCSPAPGSTFALGAATVTCTATDSAGNHVSKTFTVTVADHTAPTLADHANVTAEASSSDGAFVNYTLPTATDSVDPSPNVSCTPHSGSAFSLGDTTVTCTATDNSGNHSSKTFTVNVADHTAPTLADHANVTAEASAGGAIVDYTVPTATDSVDPSPTVSCTPAPGSSFPMGDTTVTCTATDSSGNHVSKTFTVTVSDTTPPPAPVIDTGPPAVTGTPNAPFTFHDSEPAVSFVCKIDGGPYGPCAPSYGPLGDGPHTFCVEAKDAAGNASSPTCYTWTVDTTPPPAPVIDTKPPALTSSTSGAFTYHDGEPGVGYECSLDGGPYTLCLGIGQTYGGPLADGPHTFGVRAVDGLGNTSSATTYSWTVDTQGPAAGCNVVGDVHANANFTTTIGGKKATIHVELEGDCDSVKVHDDDDDDAAPRNVGSNGIYLHHSKVQVQISGIPGDAKLIDAKQMSNNSKWKDITSVQLSPATATSPETAVLRGTYNGSAFVVTVTDSNAKGNANDTLQVLCPGFPATVLSAPHQNVHIDWK